MELTATSRIGLRSQRRRTENLVWGILRRPAVGICYLLSVVMYGLGLLLAFEETRLRFQEYISPGLMVAALIWVAGVDLLYLRPRQIFSSRQLWALRSIWVLAATSTFIVILDLMPIVQIPLLTIVAAVMVFAWGQRWYRDRSINQHVIIGMIWVVLVSVALFSAVWWAQMWFNDQTRHFVTQTVNTMSAAGSQPVPDFVLHTYRLWAFFVLAPSWLCTLGVIMLAVTDFLSACQVEDEQEQGRGVKGA